MAQGLGCLPLIGWRPRGRWVPASDWLEAACYWLTRVSGPPTWPFPGYKSLFAGLSPPLRRGSCRAGMVTNCSPVHLLPRAGQRSDSPQRSTNAPDSHCPSGAVLHTGAGLCGVPSAPARERAPPKPQPPPSPHPAPGRPSFPPSTWVKTLILSHCHITVFPMRMSRVFTVKSFRRHTHILMSICGIYFF